MLLKSVDHISRFFKVILSSYVWQTHCMSSAWSLPLFKHFWLKCHYFLNFLLAKFYLLSKCIVLSCYMNDLSVYNLLYCWTSWDILRSVKWRITFKLSHIIKCLSLLKRHMCFLTSNHPCDSYFILLQIQFQYARYCRFLINCEEL